MYNFSLRLQKYNKKLVSLCRFQINHSQNNNMKHQIALFVLALACTATVLTSCGKDDDELEPNKEQTDNQDPTTDNQGTGLTVKGWTNATHVPTSGRAYFENFHSLGETAEVKAELTKDGGMMVQYISTAWGSATFNVEKAQLTESNGFYVLPQGLETDIVMTHGPMGGDGGGTYAITLLSCKVSTDFKTVELVMSAFMSENHGSYKLEFKVD